MSDTHIVIVGANDTTDATLAAWDRMKRSKALVLLKTDSVADMFDSCKSALDDRGLPHTVHTIDLVGHGGPGRLRLGPTERAHLWFNERTLWNAAKLGRLLQGEGEIRLLGCSTATDGVDPTGDGPLLVGALANTLPGVTITATRCDITAEAFDETGCTLDRSLLYTFRDGADLHTSIARVRGSNGLPVVTSPFTENDLRNALIEIGGQRIAASAHDDLVEGLNLGRCHDAGLLLGFVLVPMELVVARESWRGGVLASGAGFVLEHPTDHRRLMFAERDPKRLRAALLDFVALQHSQAKGPL